MTNTRTLPSNIRINDPEKIQKCLKKLTELGLCHCLRSYTPYWPSGKNPQIAIRKMKDPVEIKEAYENQPLICKCGNVIGMRKLALAQVEWKKFLLELTDKEKTNE